MIAVKNSDFFGFGAVYRSTALLATNGVETIFTPAANVNGAILHLAEFVSEGGTTMAFVAKTSAPTFVTDGSVLCGPSGFALNSTNRVYFGKREKAIKIPAGFGLYFFNSVQEVNVALRSALYTLL